MLFRYKCDAHAVTIFITNGYDLHRSLSYFLVMMQVCCIFGSFHVSHML